MNPSDDYAANFARKIAMKIDPLEDNEFKALIQLMCWDAVKYCALKAGIINEAQNQRIQAKTDMVNLKDPVVIGPDALRRLRPGNVLGFFVDDKFIIHAMLCTGQGKAAGNKNDCVGVGKNVGWELLDLASRLQWAENGTVMAPPGMHGFDKPFRTVYIHYRPISYLAFR
jgi:hypothetical protein